MVSEDIAKSLVGMTESAAHEMGSSAQHQFDVIVTRRDDESFMSDMMMNMNRVKLEVEKGIVVSAAIG